MQALVLAALAALLSGPSAGERGGKVPWVRDAQFGLARARLEGRATMLFFAADFCGYCAKLGEEAFSDDRVVAASQWIVPVYVDCTKKGDNADLQARYNVKAMPAVIYTDADGAPLREMQNRDAPGIVKDIETVAGKVASRTTLWQPSVALAREAGAEHRDGILRHRQQQEHQAQSAHALELSVRDRSA